MDATHRDLPLERISRIFKHFSEHESLNSHSPFYSRLSLLISEQQELLELASYAKKGQPIPNLFLASVHFLLLTARDEELKAYYPSLTKDPIPNIPIQVFLNFCQKYREEIIELLSTRIVQTNAVNRTAYLMPMISSIFSQESSINLIDLGYSSGLNLNYDLYEYNYDDQATIGQSKVNIRSQVLSGQMPAFERIIPAKRKIGIDQNPLDISQVDTAMWLKALIWPDLSERFLRLESAIEIARKSPPDLRKAQKIKNFERIIGEIPSQEPLLLYHTHVLYQFSQMERKAFRNMLDRVASNRNLVYLAIEDRNVFDGVYDEKGILIELTRYVDGNKTQNIVAHTDGHATWIRWK